MHPVLFRIPLPELTLPLVGKLSSIPIYSYGVMLGLSLVVGWYLTLGLAEKEGMDRERMANNYVVTALAAVLFARLLYVATNLSEFTTVPADVAATTSTVSYFFSRVFSMREGGLVAYGGFIGGWVGSLLYLRRAKLRILPWADVAVPSLAAGLGITRVGCYLFGCDYGKPLASDAPAWLKGLGTFPKWAEATLPSGVGSPAWQEHVSRGMIDASATASLPVHPTQIYESTVGFVLLGILLAARRRQRFRGEICFLFFFLYGVARFGLEILRDDPERGNLPLALPEHVMMPLCLGIFAIAFVVAFSKSIPHRRLRQVAQGLAFLPAIAAALSLRPASFAAAQTVSLSTSQFIALASAVVFGAWYVLLDKLAVEQPEQAMDLGSTAIASADAPEPDSLDSEKLNAPKEEEPEPSNPDSDSSSNDEA
jgi:phosphatidylglycerol---prolipoprotein diacylglyceryl transferase